MVWKERMKHLSTSYGTLCRVLSSLLVKRASGAPFLCSTSDRSVAWRRFPTSVGFHVREIAKMPSIHPSAGLCCEACGAKFACFSSQLHYYKEDRYGRNVSTSCVPKKPRPAVEHAAGPHKRQTINTKRRMVGKGCAKDALGSCKSSWPERHHDSCD